MHSRSACYRQCKNGMQGQQGSVVLPAIYTLTWTLTLASIIPQGLLNHIERNERDLFSIASFLTWAKRCLQWDPGKKFFQLWVVWPVRRSIDKLWGRNALFCAGCFRLKRNWRIQHTVFREWRHEFCGHGLDIDQVDWKNGCDINLFHFDLIQARSGYPDHLMLHWKWVM